MKAIGYLRDLPDRPIGAQRAAFRDYCERHGLEQGAAVVERAPAAPLAFLEVLQLLAAEPPRSMVVLAGDLRAFGDGARDQARRYLQLAALQAPLQLLDGRGVDAAIVEAWEARGTTERRRELARATMRSRALRGEALGRPPYGYRIVGRRLEVEPSEAAVVREVFRACLEEGEGVRRIAGRLNDAGLRTRRGSPWSMVAVRDMLRNPVYTGTYRRLGVVVPRAHEAIVDRARFDRVQRLLAERRTSPARQQRRSYLLTGLARCGHCGNRLIGVRRRRVAQGDPSGEYVYYQCESRTNQSRCAYHTRRAEELEQIVRQRIAEADDLTLHEPALGSEGDKAGGTGLREDLDRRRQEAKRRARRRSLDRMLELRASGQWTAEQLRSRAALLVLDDLDDEVRTVEEGRGVRLALDPAMRRPPLAAARARLIEQWDELPFEERRALLADVVAEVVVTDRAVRVRFAG